MLTPPFTLLLQVLVFVSGAVALVYQSLWMRLLSLIMGSTTYAIGTVLAAFMAGLGIGAYLIGRRADRTRRPLSLYAGLELAIGLAGLASPLALGATNAIYARCYTALHEQPGLLTFARFLIGFVFVAAPGAAMGGTLPVAARYVVCGADGVGRRVGQLYAVNTLGAAVGVIVLPFVLLPWLGIRTTLLACGATNLAIALVAWTAARRAPDVVRDPSPAIPVLERGAPHRLLIAFCLSGFSALALEVVWNRFLAMFFGSSVYSYAVILFLYLLGVVIGSTLFATLARRGRDPVRVFSVCLFLLVADLAVSVPLMDRIIYIHLVVLDALGLGFASFQVASLAAAVLVVLPPTILLGVSFPAVAAAASGEARLGTELGWVYLVNTAGTTAGALVTSFVLVAGLGLRGTLDLLAGVVAAALAITLLDHQPTPRRLAVVAATAGLAILPALLPSWDIRLLHTAISQDPPLVLQLWRAGRLADRIDHSHVLEMRDGVDVTASVVELAGNKALFVNGKPDASDAGVDRFTQTMVGHLPLLVHPSPQDVLVVGMGSGVTLAATTRHPVTAIDLVEISPEVLDLGDRHFRSVNGDALRDPRVVVHVEDGRNFIAFDRSRAYDVIINEPSNPWMTGIANLFTDDFFTQVRGRLKPGGVLCQWFHYYSMELEDVRSLVGTLHRHFAHLYGFAFYSGAQYGDLLLIASEAPVDFTRAVAAFGGEGTAGIDLQDLGRANPGELIGGLVVSPEIVDRFVAGAPLNSDDRPRIELRAPRALFVDETAPDNLRALLEGSADARLPIWPPGSRPGDTAYRSAKFDAVPPAGFRLVFSGYRMHLGSTRNATGFSPRQLLDQLTFEDAARHRIEIVSAGMVSDPVELARLAELVADGPAVVDGETSVNGNAAKVYRSPGDGARVIAWSCPETRLSYAVAIDRDAGDAGEVVAGMRCHAG